MTPKEYEEFEVAEPKYFARRELDSLDKSIFSVEEEIKRLEDDLKGMKDRRGMLVYQLT